MEKLLYRSAECAEAIGVSRAKAYELIARGGVPSLKIGGCVRVPVTEAKRMIDQKLVANGFSQPSTA